MMANILQTFVLFLIMLASAKALWPSSSSMIDLNKRRYLNTKRTTNDDCIFPDIEMKTYSQTLDHFNYGPKSYITFPQRYAINFKHWGGAKTNSPIFLFIAHDVDFCHGYDVNIGFLIDNAPRFKALSVFVEHRYYGESYPFGSKEEAYRNSTTLQYFTSAQALADFAELIIDLKKNLSAENSPVIVISGNYGGMLGAWFRLKYPHIVIGALASSAPILYFDGITPQNEFFNIVSKDYRETSESCYKTIKNSWSEIDKIAAKKNGLTLLSRMFNTCSPLKKIEELKNYLEVLYTIFAQAEEFIIPLCDGIDGEPYGSSVMKRIISGIKVLSNNSTRCHTFGTKVDKLNGWNWQECTEMMMPTSSSGPNTMFEQKPFDLNKYNKLCKELYNVTPRPHWITTQFGGHNIKKVLERFGSNIIFSNGLKDPYSVGGVLQNISSSIVSLVTENWSMDLFPALDTDPDWLVSIRNAEIKIIKNWIEDYNAKLEGNK